MTTFTYYWKTPDNARHEGEIEANDREEAFALLRARDIRAIKVEPKGWETGKGYRGVKWRVVVAITFAAAACGAVVAWWAVRGRSAASGPVRDTSQHGRIESNVVEVKSGRRVAKPRPRRQVPGLAVCGERMDEMFRHESERVLALFAQPGAKPPESLAPTPELAEDFYDAIDDAIWIEQNDPKAVAELKRIVAGMKEEAEIHLSSGLSVKDFLDHLVQRQRMEHSYRDSIIGGYNAETEDAEEMRKAINMQLRQLNFAPLN